MALGNVQGRIFELRVALCSPAKNRGSWVRVLIRMISRDISVDSGGGGWWHAKITEYAGSYVSDRCQS